MIFINCSNHPYAAWSEKQKKMTEEYGDVIDIQFPEIDPYMDKSEVEKVAECLAEKILALNPDYVMCQGEFCTTFAIVGEIKRRSPGVRTVAACSARKTSEHIDGTGKIIKQSEFDFIGYREY